MVRHGEIMNFEDIEFYDVIRKNIRKYRKKCDLTQEQFAERINYSADYICEIESSTKNKTFSLIVVTRSAKVFGIPPYSLLKK